MASRIPAKFLRRATHLCIRSHNTPKMSTIVLDGASDGHVNDVNGSPVKMVISNGTPTKKQRLMTTEIDPLRPELRFAKLTDNAFTPTRGSKLAAGFDLYSAYDYTVASKGKVLAKTDIQIAVPAGCYGRVAPRSGLAHKHFIDVGAGVIDEDYRGNVGVILFNFGEEPFEVKKGDRIAQLIMERIYLPELAEYKTLDDTERGEGGFGSTGKS